MFFVLPSRKHSGMFCSRGFQLEAGFEISVQCQIFEDFCSLLGPQSSNRG